MEIYLERIRDSLARESPHLHERPWHGFTLHWITAQNDNVPIHEDKSKGVCVKGLSDFYVSAAQEVHDVMRQGGTARLASYASEPFNRLSHDFPYEQHPRQT